MNHCIRLLLIRTDRIVRSGQAYRQNRQLSRASEKEKSKNFCKLTQNFTSPRKRNIEITAERNILGQLVILALQHELSLERLLRALSESQNWPAGTMARPGILAMK